jgi:hypothetical protein
VSTAFIPVHAGLQDQEAEEVVFEKPSFAEARRTFPRVTDAGLREAIDKGYLFYHKGTWLVDDMDSWYDLSSRSLNYE